MSSRGSEIVFLLEYLTVFQTRFLKRFSNPGNKTFFFHILYLKGRSHSLESVFDALADERLIFIDDGRHSADILILTFFSFFQAFPRDHHNQNPSQI